MVQKITNSPQPYSTIGSSVLFSKGATFVTLSMIKLFAYFLLIASLLVTAISCKVKKNKYYESKGLRSDKKPSQMAKELGGMATKQKKEYRKQLRRAEKEIKKRNRKKIKGEYY